MALKRFSIAAFFLFLTVSVANAYTVVLRNGRRVEIPNQFTVTNTTLTYEVSSGIQVTIQLSGIDIAATEWTNGEPSGAFMRRASADPGLGEPAETRRAAGRSITNKDLEPYRRTRIESELAYEKRRKELGLSQRDSAGIVDRTREQLLSIRSKDEAAEDYWRNRAGSLRSEIAANQAQVDYVRDRLGEIQSTTNSLATALPFGGPSLGYPFPNWGVNNGVGFPANNPWRFNRFRGRGQYSPFFGGNLLAVPYQSYDEGYERRELVNQLNDLQMKRAALNVRWRELEEDARRAGAYPGWLRP